MKYSIIFACCFSLLFMVLGCSNEVTTYLTVVNTYSEPVQIEVNNESVNLEGNDEYRFTLIGYRSDTILVSASGKYFYYYTARASLFTGEENTFLLAPNIGWLCLSNITSSTIEYPKYGDGYFMYDEYLNNKSNSTLYSGDSGYCKIFSPITSEYITFFIGSTRYRLTSYFPLPALGSTKFAIINNSSDYVLY